MSTIAENKKKITAGLVGASLLLGMGVTTAFFTDRVTGDFGGEEGVAVGGNNPIDIVPNDDGKHPSPTDPTHPKDQQDGSSAKDGVTDESISNRWARLNPIALKNLNPGDEVALPVQFYNGGDFAIDVRETITVTSSVPLTQNDVSNLEFRLRAASNDGVSYDTFVAADKYGAYDAADGKDITVEQVGTNKVVYKIPEHKMETKAEVIRDFYLVFDKDAKNTFQGATVTVDYIAEAKQSNNNDPSKGWETIATESITVGQTAQNVVPVKGQDVTP